MRWKRKPWQDPMHWHRRFAWWPARDEDSGMVYWFERVWMRARKFTCLHGEPVYYYGWEVRTGGDCPDVKQRPAAPYQSAPVQTGWIDRT